MKEATSDTREWLRHTCKYVSMRELTRIAITPMNRSDISTAVTRPK